MAIESVVVKRTANPSLFDAHITEDGVTRVLRVNKGMDWNDLRKSYKALKESETEGQAEAQQLGETILAELKKPIEE